MRKYNFIVCLACLMFSLVSLGSCSKDDGPEVYEVRIVAESHDHQTAALLTGTGIDNDGIEFFDFCQTLFTTTDNQIDLNLHCDNPQTKLTFKIWVNEELRYQTYGYSRIKSHIYL